MKTGTAPDSMTTWVCSEVPEAMLVRAQAASNCRKMCSVYRQTRREGEHKPESSSDHS